MYCEHCGIKIFPERPVCTRCGRSPSHEWVQLFSLAVLILAVIGNSVAGLYLLPKLSATHPSIFFFRGWLWADKEGALYDWMLLAAALLLWEFFVWRKLRKAKPETKVKGWVSRKILPFVLAAGFARAHTPLVVTRQSALGSHARSSRQVSRLALVRDPRPPPRPRQNPVSLGALAVFLMLTFFGWSLS